MNDYSYKSIGSKRKRNDLQIIPAQINLRTTLRSNKIKDFSTLGTTALLIFGPLNV